MTLEQQADTTTYSASTVFHFRNKVNIFNIHHAVKYDPHLSDLFFLPSRKGHIPLIKVLNLVQLRDVCCHVPGTATINIPKSDDIPQ